MKLMLSWVDDGMDDLFWAESEGLGKDTTTIVMEAASRE
jgi:hypothetical protein